MPHLRALILTEHVRSFRNSIMGGGSNIEGESLSCQLTFEALAKQKNASAQGSLKFLKVSNSFWKGTRRKITLLKKVCFLLLYLVSPSEHNVYFYMWFYCAFYKFLEVQIMHI